MITEKVLIALIAGFFGFITPVIVWHLSELTRKRKAAEEEGDHKNQHWEKVNAKIERILERLFFKLNENNERPDKIFLLEFDNGVKYFSGRPLQKVSITNIFPPEKQDFALKQQQINISVFNPLFTSIRSGKGWVVCEDVEKEKNPVVKFMLQSSGCSSGVWRWVLGENQKEYLGVLVVHYKKPLAVTEIDEDLVFNASKEIFNIIKV